MKRSLKDVLILLGIAIISFLVAHIVSDNFLIDIKNYFINGFFTIKKAQESAITEGVRKVEFEGLKIFSDDILIVGIDDKTLLKLGKFPFSRTNYYEYILKPFLSITNGKIPSAVFFDIIFPENSSQEDDKVFISGLSKSKDSFKVMFDYLFYFGTDPSSESLGLRLDEGENAKRIQLLKKFTIPRENIRGKYLYTRPPVRGLLPIEGILTNSYILGHANLVQYFENTDTFNSVPMILKYKDDYYPSIVLALLCSYYDVSISNVFVELGKEVIIKKAKVKYFDGSYEIKDIRIPVNEENLFFINYVSRSDRISGGAIRTISFIDIPRVKGLDRFGEGKLFMMGMLAYGYGDIWKSPTDPSMYGIEHLANAVNNVIMANIQNYPGYVIFIPNYVVTLISLLFALIATLVLILNRNIILSFLEVIGVFILFVFISYFLFSQGTILFKNPISSYAYLMDVLKPALSLIFAYIGGQIFVIIKERAQRMQIKSMLDSYVSPEVVDILIKNPEKLTLGGEDREVTVFFSDIRGFTSLSEGMSPQDLVSLINKYLSRMTDIIMDNRGTVDKYIGDAIMAFWGAPLDDPEHPFRACKASLEMLSALKEINDTLPPDKQIDIGIGINTGIATIGNMGSSKKKNYTAMGDTVNLASRLEGVNKMFHTRIIISEYTFEKVKDKILARELDLIRVKGKKLPVRIYEVIGFLSDYEPIIKEMGLQIEELQADI